ncbi:hypothetical protein GCM10009838_01070 [Catenulispora subtropica]|uniref:Uncharacterized protein n=1 Tax=Catenulispora subtropica TaxID=450798 RepID=A0ABN2QCW3_9ACTN
MPAPTVATEPRETEDGPVTDEAMRATPLGDADVWVLDPETPDVPSCPPYVVRWHQNARTRQAGAGRRAFARRTVAEPV